LNYHDFGKARGFARNNPGASGGAQAARKTGPVIRMAAAHKRASKVMAGLLAEKPEGIKSILN